jgi:methionyl-tRNA formyltransferase
LNIIYAGTPEFAAIALQALINSEHHICAVYTQPDRPAGRGRRLKASPVKELALTHDIEVLQPQSLKMATEQQTLAAFNADVMVVAAYGLILPEAILETPKLGCLNIHASLLPRWRGAAPIQRAISEGDIETGVTIMQMDIGLDTGEMLLKKQTPILAEDTAQTLHDRLAQLGADAILETLEQLSTDKIKAVKQNEAATCYAKKLSKSEADIDWSDNAVHIARLIAAFNPWPVAQTSWDDKTVRIWNSIAVDTTTNAEAGTVIHCDKEGIDVACGSGVLRILKLQLPGGKPLGVRDFINAHSLSGVVFGATS